MLLWNFRSCWKLWFHATFLPGLKVLISFTLGCYFRAGSYGYEQTRINNVWLREMNVCDCVGSTQRQNNLCNHLLYVWCYVIISVFLRLLPVGTRTLPSCSVARKTNWRLQWKDTKAQQKKKKKEYKSQKGERKVRRGRISIIDNTAQSMWTSDYYIFTDINLLPPSWFEADRQILLPFSHRSVSEVIADVSCGVWLTVSLTNASQSHWSGKPLVSEPGFVPGGIVLKQEEAFPRS